MRTREGELEFRKHVTDPMERLAADMERSLVPVAEISEEVGEESIDLPVVPEGRSFLKRPLQKGARSR